MASNAGLGILVLRMISFWRSHCQCARRLFCAGIIAFCAAFSTTTLHAIALPWPGEEWSAAVNLTALDSEFALDLSGAHWNEQSQTLFVCQNGVDKVWELGIDGTGSWVVLDAGFHHEWDLGTLDLEGLTQADLASDIVYVIDEAGAIRSYDLSTSDPVALHSWDIASLLPTAGGAGPEAIVFISDFWLNRRGFVDDSGNPVTSLLGLGGLVFVGHQNGGNLYVFDLAPGQDNVFTFVGTYTTSRTETAGLEFDSAVGWLYIWHNTDGNILEISDLRTTPVSPGVRALRTIVEYQGPDSGNLEGFAATSQSNPNRWAFLTKDGGGTDSLRWFQQFIPLRLLRDGFETGDTSQWSITVP